MADDLSILQEIDESIRADKLAEFWQRFGNQVLAACAGIIILTIASVVWKNHMHTLHVKETALLLQAESAMQAGKNDEAQHLLQEAQKGSASIAAIALLKEAALALKNNEPDKAAALYAKARNEHVRDTDTTLPDFATLQLATLDDNAHRPMQKTDASKDGRPFAYALREMEAAELLNAGKGKEAKALLTPIAGDVRAPAPERARAMEMLDSIEGSANE